MFQGIFVALGAGALLLMLSTAFVDLADSTRTIFSLLSMVLWFVWGINASEVTAPTPATTVNVTVNGTQEASSATAATVTQGYPSLTVVGLVFGGIMAISFVMQSINLLQDSKSL